MKKIIFVLLPLSCLFLFSGCESGEEAYQRGYNKGVYAGTSEAKKEFDKKLETRNSANKEELEQRIAEYEKKIVSAYAAAYQKGRESMQSDLNETISIK